MTTLQKNTVPGQRLREVSAPSAQQRQRSLLLFHLGGQAYGLPLREVEEILPLATLSCPPNLPSILAGFLNLGGTAVPVLRLDRLFELPAVSPARYTPLVLLRNADYRLALLVDEVSRILTVAENALVPIGAQQSFNDCVEAVATVDDHVVLLLSAQRILLEKEQQCLAEFQDREQARLRALEDVGP
jgi:purine-binding chemotaxis protein CheW